MQVVELNLQSIVQLTVVLTNMISRPYARDESRKRATLYAICVDCRDVSLI